MIVFAGVGLIWTSRRGDKLNLDFPDAVLSEAKLSRRIATDEALSAINEAPIVAY